MTTGPWRAVGAGEIAPEQMQELLDMKNPNAVPAMAPSCGLYLAKVHYDGTRKWAPRLPKDRQVGAAGAGGGGGAGEDEVSDE